MEKVFKGHIFSQKYQIRSFGFRKKDERWFDDWSSFLNRFSVSCETSWYICLMINVTQTRSCASVYLIKDLNIVIILLSALIAQKLIPHT